MPAASTVKVLISAAMWCAVEEGALDAGRRLTAGEAPAPGGGGLLESFDRGTALTLADLDILMLAVSDNAATNALMEVVGLDRVNALAARLGLTRTAVRRPMMDVEAAERGDDNTTCAGDMAALMAALGRAAEIPLRACRRVLHGLGQSHHTDVIARHLSAPGRVVACKQGMLAVCPARRRPGRGRARPRCAGGALVAPRRRRGACPAGGADPRRGHRSLTIARRPGVILLVVPNPFSRGGGMRELLRRVFKLSIPIAAIAVAAGCGGGGSSSSGSSGGGGTAAAGTPQKGGTLTILANSSFGVADPAQNYTLQEWALLIDTHDGLVQFKRVGGSEGTQLVPDLATEIPQPTDGGKTYTFNIRKGIKYSDGTTMKPSDFVTTFERQFTVPGPTSFYSGHRRRGQVHGEELRPVAGRGRRRQRVHADDPPDGIGSGVPRQAGAPVRVCRPRQHVAQEPDRQRRAAGHRPVHVAVVRPEQGSGARPQPELQGVEPGRAA